jgi:hypothetical protein
LAVNEDLTKIVLEPRCDSGISFLSIASDFVHIACIETPLAQGLALERNLFLKLCILREHGSA